MATPSRSLGSRIGYVLRSPARWLVRPNAAGELSIGRWVVLSLMVGVVAGLGAAGLQWAIDFVNRTTLVSIAGFSPPGLPTEGGRREFEHDAVIPALLTSVVAYSVYSLIFGWSPMFATQRWEFNHPEHLLVYLVLGVAVAALGWCYVTVFYALHEHVFARLPVRGTSGRRLARS